MLEQYRHKEKIFSLIHEPWIEITWLNGKIEAISLKELFKNANSIKALTFNDSAAELGTIRILLAIIYAAVQLPTRDNPDLIEELPVAEILQYLEKHEDEFYLIHPTNPFMQNDYLLSHASSKMYTADFAGIHYYNGGGKLVGARDYFIAGEDSLTYADAIRILIGMNTFAKGQTYGPYPPSADNRGQSASPGVYAGKYAVVPFGVNLEETLLMNLVPAAVSDLGKPYWEYSCQEREKFYDSPLFLLTFVTKNHYFILNGNNEVAYVLRGSAVYDKSTVLNNDNFIVKTFIPDKDSDDPDAMRAVPITSKLYLWKDIFNFITPAYSSRAFRFAMNENFEPEWFMVYGCDSNSTDLPTYLHRKTYPIPRNHQDVSLYLGNYVNAVTNNGKLSNSIRDGYLKAIANSKAMENVFAGNKPNLMISVINEISERSVENYLNTISTKYYSVDDEANLYNYLLKSFTRDVLSFCENYCSSNDYMVRANFLQIVKTEMNKLLKREEIV